MALNENRYKGKIEKLLGYLTNNGVSMQRAVGYGLDASFASICQQACQSQEVQYDEFADADKISIKNHIVNHAIDTIFVQKRDIRFANDLLWSCRALRQYICVDSDDLAHEADGKNMLMNRKLWDYTANNAKDDIEGGGWISSYTREKFTKQEMGEYVQNVVTKLAPYLDKSKKALEVGCSSGLTMFALAPLVKEYVALDMSSGMIKKDKEKIRRESIRNIRLYCLQAHELASLEESDFDVGIINSVIHCFEGHLYFKRVFRMLIDKMNGDGLIFLGDVLDADKKSDFEKSLAMYRDAHGTNTKVDFSQELFLSRDFIQDLCFDYPEISHLSISDKFHTIENELTQYRYDVLMALKKNMANPRSGARHKFQFACDIS